MNYYEEIIKKLETLKDNQKVLAVIYSFLNHLKIED